MKYLVVLLIFCTSSNADYSFESSSLTYTTDIKPIFKKRCSQCHDYMEGKNWQIYKDAFSRRDKIKERIENKTMPMGLDMPQYERDMIIKWVDEGAKE